MFKIKDGKIYHLRGDTAEFDVNITDDGTPLENYEAVFTVKRMLKDSKYLFQKPVIDGHVRIEHSDTQNLPYGNYYYDIAVRIDDGTEEGRYVSLPPDRYFLMADVTTEWGENDEP